MNYAKKNSICIDFVHKITFWSHFRSDVHVQKVMYLQNRTPGRHKFGVKMCGKLERKKS